jgi:hypothetical protein
LVVRLLLVEALEVRLLLEVVPLVVVVLLLLVEALEVRLLLEVEVLRLVRLLPYLAPFAASTAAISSSFDQEV